MKQNIDIQQLNELSEKGRCNLYIWWHKNKRKGNFYTYLYDTGTVPYYGQHAVIEDQYLLLSVGQMIEFLDKHSSFHWYENWIEAGSWDLIIPDASELCDALWEACKDILEKDISLLTEVEHR